MDNKANFKIEDLTMVLEAIHNIRTEWIECINKNAWEYMFYNKGVTFEQAKMEVLLKQEVHELHMRLITLYGCIGSDAPAYIEALKDISPDAEILPFKKSA